MSSSWTQRPTFHLIAGFHTCRMAAVVKAIKANATSDVIVLDAGDQFTGTGAKWSCSHVFLQPIGPKTCGPAVCTSNKPSCWTLAKTALACCSGFAFGFLFFSQLAPY